MKTIISVLLLIGAMILACIFCTFFIVFNLIVKEINRIQLFKQDRQLKRIETGEQNEQ